MALFEKLNEDELLRDDGDCLCKHRGTPAEQAMHREDKPEPKVQGDGVPNLSFKDIADLLAYLVHEVKELREKIDG